METNSNQNSQKQLSAVRIKRLRVQGYLTQSEAELNALVFGHRLTFRLCFAVISIALLTANLYILSAMVVIAALGIVLPYHPFDYLYNEVIRKRIDGPKLPRRSMQLKFACMMAVPWLIATIYLFNTGQALAGYILGGLLMASAFMVGFLDMCFPSMIYNALFGKKVTIVQSN